MRHLNTFRFIEVIGQEGSIRKAAVRLAITSTALNRRVLALEYEMGYPLFERLPRGVRLNTAGEIFVDFIRRQFADLDRVKSQIADLAGVRRGRVSIACAPEVIDGLLPGAIAAYRAEHPQVSFQILGQHGAAAENALIALKADIAITVEPVASPQFKIMATVPQPPQILITKTHPIAQHQSVRIRDLIGHRLILPSANTGLGRWVRTSLLALNLPLDVLPLDTMIESDRYSFIRQYLHCEECIGFTIPAGLGGDSTLTALPIDGRDMPPCPLNIGQLKDRVLPVASAKFLNSLADA